MADFLVLMHDDAQEPVSEDLWPAYFAQLVKGGHFVGGSAMGGGRTIRRNGTPRPLTDTLVGFYRVIADDLGQAEALLAGNPVFEAGGTIELRDLPKD